MEITDKAKRLLGAVRDGKVTDEKTLGTWQLLEEVLDAVGKLEELAKKVEGKHNESKADVIKGITPSKDDILAILKPFIPDVKDGETPDDKRLLALIRPLIKKPKNGKDGKPGKTPDMGTIIQEATNLLEARLQPFIPTPEALAAEFSKNPTLVRDALESLQEEDRLDISALGGITISNTAPEDPKEGQLWVHIS